MHYEVGEPVGIYRIYEGNLGKTAVTSYCTITKIDVIKNSGKAILSYAEFVKSAGNKTVFTPEELAGIYAKNNVVMLELLYNGFFGKGHNVQ